jgi:hypothetical protein
MDKIINTVVYLIKFFNSSSEKKDTKDIKDIKDIKDTKDI